MKRIAFTVPGTPIPQPRQRHRVIPGTQFAHNYTPTKHPVNDFKATVKLCFSQAHNAAPLEGRIGLQVAFVMPRPANMVWGKRPMPRVYRNRGRGDWDNITKALADALNGMAWRDDKQICSVKVDVYTAGGDEQPHCEVEIWEIEE